MIDERLVDAISALAKMTKIELGDYGFDRYCKVLSEYPLDSVLKQLEYFYDNFKFPSINDVKERMGVKELTNQAKAKMIAEEIMRMVVKVGCPHPAAKKEAMANLSELARVVVENRGGWHLVCEMTNADVQFRMRDFEQSALVAIMSGSTEEYRSLKEPNPHLSTLLSACRDPSKPEN